MQISNDGVIEQLVCVDDFSVDMEFLKHNEMNGVFFVLFIGNNVHKIQWHQIS